MPFIVILLYEIPAFLRSPFYFSFFFWGLTGSGFSPWGFSVTGIFLRHPWNILTGLSRILCCPFIRIGKKPCSQKMRAAKISKIKYKNIDILNASTVE